LLKELNYTKIEIESYKKHKSYREFTEK